MYKLESLNEHLDRLDTVDLLENRDKCINAIVETLNDQVSYDDIDQMMVSEFFGLGRLLKGIFVNPFVKRKIRKLVEELVAIRVQLVRAQLDEDPDDLEDILNDMDEKKGRKAFDAKVEALRDQESTVEAKMDLLSNGDERLERYVELQKIEAKIKANQMTIKMADTAQTKILRKYNKEIEREAKSIVDDLEECYSSYPSEKAQGLNEKKFDATPETVASRNKVQDLHNKESELLSKARELETKGEEVKAGVARLTAKQMDIKADLELISMRIKKLKKRL